MRDSAVRHLDPFRGLGIEGLENKFQQLAHIRREQIGRDAVVAGGNMGEVRYCQGWMNPRFAVGADEKPVRLLVTDDKLGFRIPT